MNLLLCGRETCEEVYAARKYWAAMLKENEAKNIDIEKQPGGDALDFDEGGPVDIDL